MIGRYAAMTFLVALVLTIALQPSSSDARQPRWVLYQPKVPLGGAGGISMGADDAIWFSVSSGFLKAWTGGDQRAFASPRLQPGGLALGADLRVYSAQCCDASGTGGIVAAGPHGRVSFYPLNSQSGDPPNDGIVLGPDGNMWFTQFQHFGNITPGGRITEYQLVLPGGLLYNATTGIARDGSGHVWFSIPGSSSAAYMVMIDVAHGAVETLFRAPCLQLGAPVGGSDGSVYVACSYVTNSQQVIDLMRVSPKGKMKLLGDPYQLSADPYEFVADYMTTTPGKIWFVTGTPYGELGEYEIASGRFTAYLPPPTVRPLLLIGADRAGHIWFESVPMSQDAMGEFELR